MRFLSPFMLNVYAWLLWLAIWLIAARSVQRTRSSEGWLPWLQVKIPQFLGLFLIFHAGHWSLIRGRLYDHASVELAGTSLTLLGLSFAVWARVHLGRYWSGMITLKEGHKLIRTGPYRLARHPIYTGFLSALLGSAITASTADAFIGFALIAAACILKSRREEALLVREFGDEYVRFKSEVPALLPLPRRIAKWRTADTATQPH